MCSHDLHIGQYMHCPDLILFTCFPTIPTLKCPQAIHIFFCLFIFDWEEKKNVIFDRTKSTQTVTPETVKCRKFTEKKA